MKITVRKLNNHANDERAGCFEEGKLLYGTMRLSDNFAAADPSHKLIVTPQAAKEIFEFIEWDVGEREDARVEQGGILLGKRCFDEEKNVHFTVVEKAITADGAVGSSGYLDITHECWMRMHEKKDRYNLGAGEEAIIVGWFHTHPNLLPCFMSGTDRKTQDLFFNGENTYSVVINPQRHLMKAFRSDACLPAQMFFLLGYASETRR